MIASYCNKLKLVLDFLKNKPEINTVEKFGVCKDVSYWQGGAHEVDFLDPKIT